MSNEELKKIIEHRFLYIRGWKNWKEYDNIINSTEGDINCRNELIEIAIQETLKLINKNHSQQIKKDSSEGSNTNYLETRSNTEEENKQERKSKCVDNQSADTNKKIK